MIKNYNQFLITEKYDKFIRSKLIGMGIKDEEEIERQIELAKSGFLSTYLSEKGDHFTFGILNAIFKDAIRAKKITNIKKGIHNILPSIVPLAFNLHIPLYV